MATFYIDPINGNDANDGLSFANRIQNVTQLGAKGAVSGDSARVIASATSVSIGTCTWTNASATVSIPAGTILAIDTCDNAWTGTANVTATAAAANRKQGTNAASLAIAAGFTTGKIAYRALGATNNYSSYNKVSFWIRSSVALAASTLQLALCSDTTGDTPVNSITITNAITPVNQWHRITIDTGGALGSAIQSVALYALLDPGTVTILLDNIFACNNLCLMTPISKNVAGEGWYLPQSITGTSVILDYMNNTVAGSAAPYFGATESVTTYAAPCMPLNGAISLSPVFAPAVSGMTISGGWNTTDMSTQTGNSFFVSNNGQGWFLVLANNVSSMSISKIGAFGYTSGTVISANNYGNSIDSCYFSNTASFGMTNTGGYSMSITNNIVVGCANYGISDQQGGNNFYNNNKIYSTLVAGFNADGANNIINNMDIRVATNSFWFTTGTGHRINSATTHSGAAVTLSSQAGFNQNINFYNCTFPEATRVSFAAAAAGSNSQFFFQKLNGDLTNNIMYTNGGTVSSSTSNRKSGAGLSWQYAPTSALVTSSQPLQQVIGTIACRANKLVTATVWIYRDNTGISANLVCKGGQISGVTNDVVASASGSAASFEQLTITFTPTEDGVVELTAQAYGGTTYNVWFSNLAVYQA